MDDKILEKMEIARKKDPRILMSISDKIVKLQEEVGEIAAAHLKEIGFKSRFGKTLEEVRNNKKEEYADTLLVIYDIILSDGFTFDEIKEELHRGIDKWYDKVSKI